jgi:riboflavin synthase alpha subunit
MFTGIVQDVGTIRSRRRGATGVSFTLAGLTRAGKIGVGDSVAVNGVCQTVEAASPGEIVFTAVGETLERTTLEALRAGSRVNLETAAKAGSPLGGHIVQGHVDGVGTVRSFARRGRDWILKVKLPAGYSEFVVPKGSIAIDGVSLTVIDCLRGGVVTATVVPFTLERTIAGGYRPGARVNIETDILARYVQHFIGRGAGTRDVQARRGR